MRKYCCAKLLTLLLDDIIILHNKIHSIHIHGMPALVIVPPPLKFSMQAALRELVDIIERVRKRKSVKVHLK